jgi:RNA polymerase-binding transcription factor DksA
MMTEQQRRYVEDRLLDERSKALAVLQSLESDVSEAGTESGGDLSAYPTHPADRATDASEREVDLALLERNRDRIRVIDDALRRLHEDPENYDRSVVSGRQIPFTRLDLIPWTRVCVDETEPAYDLVEEPE